MAPQNVSHAKASCASAMCKSVPLLSKNPSLSHTMYATHPILPQGFVSQFGPEKGVSSRMEGNTPPKIQIGGVISGFHVRDLNVEACFLLMGVDSANKITKHHYMFGERA